MRPPSVDTLARELGSQHPDLPHALLVQAARDGIASAMAAGTPENCAVEASTAARRAQRRMLQPVVNATGTLLHTNLGRAPHRQTNADGGPVRYSSLEFDLESGQRGSRRNHAADQLATLSGAESALVVNNCAAALMLVIAALARGRGVAVSRGELVEIGGAFRIPDVLSSQGARLVEVGTTNRTRAADYERVLCSGAADVGMVLSVHRSNYRISGFTETTSVAQLSAVARPRRVPVVVDTGSGLLDSRMPWLADSSGKVPSLPWLADEPANRQTLDAGADLIVFSGDKLLGGPQAGVIAGRADLVDQCAKHPLARALRPGGTVLGELQSVCAAYLDRRARELPFWEMACRPVEQLRRRADDIVSTVGRLADGSFTATACMSVPGGGTLPDAEIPSYGLLMAGNHLRMLREGRPPIIARTQGDSTLLDLRTVDPLDDLLLIERLSALSIRR
jgi:L-seryl-tRNA(Ser) seleniumtransferase